MNAIIVDDELDGIRTMQKMLSLYCPQVTILASFSNAEEAKKGIGTLQPDVVFLDIQMPGKSGLDLLAELSPCKFAVVFVTAYNEYLLQALQFSAVDYLLKPVDEDRLVEAIKRVKERLGTERQEEAAEALLYNLQVADRPAVMRLCLPTFKGFLIVKLESILYCEAERSYTIFHLENGKTITVSRSLVEYEALLTGTTFLRVHKSFLVNLLHVKEYQRGEGGIIIMSNNHEIEVSRRKKEVFLDRVKKVFRG